MQEPAISNCYGRLHAVPAPGGSRTAMTSRRVATKRQREPKVGGTRTRRTIASFGPRPMATEIVEDRLRSIASARKRSVLALHIAETCYECFSIENLFRELIDRNPEDLDGILTALVNIDISLRHIADHWRRLERPLQAAIGAVDRGLSLRSSMMTRRRTKSSMSRIDVGRTSTARRRLGRDRS